MFEIRKNTYLIDTPGIKELGVVAIEGSEISHFFPEMRAVLGNCKFNTCTHRHEPQCAVIEAVESGLISASRYHSYLSIFDNEDTFR
jgi:ribosome biogenesis GTPase